MYPDSHFDNTQITTTPDKIVDIIEDYWVDIQIIENVGEDTYVAPITGEVYHSSTSHDMVCFETIFGNLYVHEDEKIKVRVVGEKDVLEEIKGRLTI